MATYEGSLVGMDVVPIGKFFSLIALGVAMWSFRSARYRSIALPWRLLAAIGEGVYFWTPWSTGGAVLFVIGAALTVYNILRGSSWQVGIPQVRKDAIELIELIAWLWMLNALR